jgi:hypothetical protein
MDYDETAFASGLVRGLVEPGTGPRQGCSERSAAAASPRLDPAAETAASRLQQHRVGAATRRSFSAKAVTAVGTNSSGGVSPQAWAGAEY